MNKLDENLDESDFLEAQQRDIIKGCAEDMSVPELLEHKNRTSNPEVIAILESEIFQENACPDCSGELFLDENENILYCPVGHREYEI